MAAPNKNKIYDVLKELLKYEISDIHMLQDSNVYIRNSSGDLVPQEVIFTKDEIWGFVHDFLTVDKIDSLMDGHEVDTAHTIGDSRLRINIYYDKDGIRLALRKIASVPPSMEDIALPDYIKDFLNNDKGLILVTGPTGSGKSTTLAAMIDYINKTRKSHIITLEDPIEYVYQKKNCLITQREVGKNSKNWQDSMKYALRQDPDVIMVGEMRDLETIGAALTLVETGHLVLSTLHTIDAPQTITRIIDIFPPYQQEQIAVQLSMTLALIISQRLVPKKTGDGRVATREILVNTPAIANNIRERKIPQIVSLMETGFKAGMKTMDQDMAYLVARGDIDLNYALGRVKNSSSFKNLLSSIVNGQNTYNIADSKI